MKATHSDHPDIEYQDLLRFIMESGNVKTDRTGTGTKSVFGPQMRFDLQKAFPLLTTKKVNFDWIVKELLWFLKGNTNIKELVDGGVHIWNEWPYKAYLQKQGLPVPDSNSTEWKDGMKAFVDRVKTDETFAKEHGELGPVYGKQWISWPKPDGGTINQIADIVAQLKKSPDSRRMIVCAWNVADIPQMAVAGLPPCHCLFQFYVADGKLSCQLYQRSADTFLGVPFNIASYSLLTLMLAQVCGLKPGEFIWTGGDTHIYSNHFTQVEEQLSRTPLVAPMVELNPEIKDIFNFKLEDIKLVGYEHLGFIKAPVAV